MALEIIQPIHIDNTPIVIKDAFCAISKPFEIPRKGLGFINGSIVFEPKFPFIQLTNFFILKEFLEEILIELDNGIACNGKITYDLKDLLPYFEEYSNGFYYGYKTFLDYKVYPNTDCHNNDEIKRAYIFNYANSNSIWHKGFFGWKTVDKNDRKNGNIIDENLPNPNFKSDDSLEVKEHAVIADKEKWYLAGVNGGYYYKSWHTIITHGILYIQLFEEMKKTSLVDYDHLRIDLIECNEIEPVGKEIFNISLNRLPIGENPTKIVFLNGANARRFCITFFKNSTLQFNKYCCIKGKKTQKLRKLKSNDKGTMENAPEKLKVIFNKFSDLKQFSNNSI